MKNIFEMFRKTKLNKQPPGEVDKNVNHFYQHLAKSLRSFLKKEQKTVAGGNKVCTGGLSEAGMKTGR